VTDHVQGRAPGGVVAFRILVLGSGGEQLRRRLPGSGVTCSGAIAGWGNHLGPRIGIGRRGFRVRTVIQVVELVLARSATELRSCGWRNTVSSFGPGGLLTRHGVKVTGS